MERLVSRWDLREQNAQVEGDEAEVEDARKEEGGHGRTWTYLPGWEEAYRQVRVPWGPQVGLQEVQLVEELGGTQVEDGRGRGASWRWKEHLPLVA